MPSTRGWSLAELFPEDLEIGIVDIGAAFHDAPPAYQALVDAGRARITGFEPDAAECDKLNRRYGPPHRFLPHFVGNGKTGTFHETTWNLTGSLFPPNMPLLEKFQMLPDAMRPVAQHPVATVRLDDLAELGDVDLFKIDVQGAELSVFENATRALASAVMVWTEVEFVEMYRGQPLFADVDAHLRQSGFQFHAFESESGRTFKPLVANNDINAKINQLLWADAVYVRDWMHLDALSPAKLRAYAVLAHDLCASYDLVHVVLSELDRRTGGAQAASYLRRLTSG